MHVELTTEEVGREIARADDRRFRHKLVQRDELCERLITSRGSTATPREHHRRQPYKKQ